MKIIMVAHKIPAQPLNPISCIRLVNNPQASGNNMACNAPTKIREAQYAGNVTM